jgi:putative tryptophan/tyrosine transport system substrate-binding protein
MRRREFMRLVAGVAAWPLNVSAQALTDRKVARVGILSTGPITARQRAFDAFKGRLREVGWTEGRNLIVEVRSTEGQANLFRELATELDRLNLDVIVAFGGPAALAAKEILSSAIPIVMIAADPVGLGLVAGLARPGGNITGVADLTTELSAKRLEILREAAPTLSKVGVLWNELNPGAARTAAETEAAGRKLGLRIRPLPVRTPHGLDFAFETISADEGAVGVLIVHDPFMLTYRNRIAELTAKHRVPAIYGFREFVDAGGLMSYGTDFADAYRKLATAVDKILGGAHPGDMPVEQPTKFELVINLKAAKALGLTMPPPLLVRADEVIE